MKLQVKIQLFSSLFMLLLILLINTSIYYMFYLTSTDSELSQLKSHAIDIVEKINSEPDIVKSELLEAYLPTNGMIRVTKEDGSPLIRTLTKQSEYTSLSKEYTTKESEEIVKRDDGTSVAVITKPIIWSNGEIVTLQISKHLISLKEMMRTLFFVLTFASILMLIPIVIAGNVLSRFLLRPIKALIETMKENTKYADWKKINIENRSQDELYQMELTFNDMIDYLKENFKKQEQFVSDASHELRTPISIMKSYAQLLKRRGKERPEVFDEAVQAIDSEADRMQSLVEQMLLLAKNQEEMVQTDIDIIPVCKEVKRTFSGAYTREMKMQVSSEAIFVHGNGDQLKQVIYILMDNALKYSEKEVELQVVAKGDNVLVKVIDYGDGISLEEQERIFDRFYRVDKARSRDTGGTGLGLSIAKTIATIHHGNLSVSSDIGEGTTFILTLPRIRKDKISEILSKF